MPQVAVGWSVLVADRLDAASESPQLTTVAVLHKSLASGAVQVMLKVNAEVAEPNPVTSI